MIVIGNRLRAVATTDRKCAHDWVPHLGCPVVVSVGERKASAETERDAHRLIEEFLHG